MTKTARLKKAYDLADKRDGGKCVLCEYLSQKLPSGNWLSKMIAKKHVYSGFGKEHHHIRGRKNDYLDDIDNIITLCKYHHDLVGTNKNPETGEGFTKIGITAEIRLYLDDVLIWWEGQK